MMKKMTILAAVLSLGIFCPIEQVHAFQCDECHSKNPSMVRMHKALQGRGCIGCHKLGEKLMGKSRPKDKNSLLRQRVADRLCSECHSGKSLEKDAANQD